MANRSNIIICLIASGETAWQGEGRMQGNTDLPMSDTGTSAVAAAAATWIAPKQLRTIYCAPDEASIRTAEQFARRAEGAKVKTIDDLIEIDLGLWQGLPCEQLKDRYPKAYQQWRQNSTQVTPPEGESMLDADQRLRTTLRQLCRKNGDKPVAFVLRPILHYLATTWLDDEEHPAPYKSGDYPEPRQFVATPDRLNEECDTRRIPA